MSKLSEVASQLERMATDFRNGQVGEGFVEALELAATELSLLHTATLDEETMVLFAIRYALTRHSTATLTALTYLRTNWKHLSATTRHYITRDIRDKILELRQLKDSGNLSVLEQPELIAWSQFLDEKENAE